MEIKNKINEKGKCYPSDSNIGLLDQTSVLTHESYVNKISKNNATNFDRNQDLGIFTIYISLVLHNLWNV